MFRERSRVQKRKHVMPLHRPGFPLHFPVENNHHHSNGQLHRLQPHNLQRHTHTHTSKSHSTIRPVQKPAQISLSLGRLLPSTHSRTHTQRETLTHTRTHTQRETYTRREGDTYTHTHTQWLLRGKKASHTHAVSFT